jgi:hypothetical protein
MASCSVFRVWTLSAPVKLAKVGSQGPAAGVFTVKLC